MFNRTGLAMVLLVIVVAGSTTWVRSGAGPAVLVSAVMVVCSLLGGFMGRAIRESRSR